MQGFIPKAYSPDPNAACAAIEQANTARIDIPHISTGIGLYGADKPYIVGSHSEKLMLDARRLCRTHSLQKRKHIAMKRQEYVYESC